MDRYALSAILAAGALFVDALTGERVLAYLAGAIGVFAIHERLRREFLPSIALLTSTLVFAGTSLFWTMTRATSMVEAVVFASVAAAAFSLGSPLSPRMQALIWSAIALLPPAIGYLLTDSATGGATDRLGSFNPLFSSANGLLSLTPVVYIALVGTLFYVRRNVTWTAGTLLTLAVWVSGAAMMGVASPDPFGHRLTGILALTAPGLALIVDRGRTRPLVAVVPLVAAVVLWNYWLMVQYTAGLLPKDAPVSFAAMVRQQAEVHTRSPYWYPFAFPANAWFAWREGVPIERYEQLSAYHPRDGFDLLMDRNADPFLLEGWGPLAPTPSGPVRWTTQRRSTVLFPLLKPTTTLTIHVTFNARVEEPLVAVDMGILINDTEVGRLSALPSAGDAQLGIPAALVGRVLRAGYNRLDFVNYGIHRIDPADARPAGPLAARSATSPFPVAVHRIRFAPQMTQISQMLAGHRRGAGVVDPGTRR